MVTRYTQYVPFFPAAVFVTEPAEEKKKANIKIHVLKVKQFKWVYSFFE